MILCHQLTDTRAMHHGIECFAKSAPVAPCWRGCQANDSWVLRHDFHARIRDVRVGLVNDKQISIRQWATITTGYQRVEAGNLHIAIKITRLAGHDDIRMHAARFEFVSSLKYELPSRRNHQHLAIHGMGALHNISSAMCIARSRWKLQQHTATMPHRIAY